MKASADVYEEVHSAVSPSFLLLYLGLPAAALTGLILLTALSPYGAVISVSWAVPGSGHRASTGKQEACTPVRGIASTMSGSSPIKPNCARLPDHRRTTPSPTVGSSRPP
jgi:hypothetical protein